jgi:hypothetical protein
MMTQRAGRPATRVRIPRQQPPELALRRAKAVAQRVYKRPTQVRRAFIERRGRPDSPPLAKMLRGGRGGMVRLKLYLAILWIASGGDHTVTFPARAWAQLLGLDDPQTNGARRVTDAIAWLEDHQLVRATRQRGRPPELVPLDEGGTGKAYRVPSRTWQEDAEQENRAANIYVQLPVEFWTSGWAAVLSAPAIAMLLVLLAERGPKDPKKFFWFTPDQADQRYDLSEDTRTRGITELEQAGIITIKRKPVNQEMGWSRVRNHYRLNLERLILPLDLQFRARRTPKRPGVRNSTKK